jgi:hypothetical protein
VFYLAFIALAAAACGSAEASATPMPSATPLPPTPTLRPAGAYIEGQEDAPEGRYLFVEYFVVDGGSSPTGNCPNAAMIDFPGYSFTGGVLQAMPGPLPTGEGVLGYAAFGSTNTGAMGGGVSSRLDVIMDLPFSLPYDVVIIHTVAADGEIVAEVGGAEYLIGPGESWAQTSEWDPTPECHRTSVTRFTNHGLLDESRLDLD